MFIYFFSIILSLYCSSSSSSFSSCFFFFVVSSEDSAAERVDSVVADVDAVLLVNIFVNAPNKLLPLVGLPLDLAEAVSLASLLPLDCPELPELPFFESPLLLLLDEELPKLLLVNNQYTSKPINTTTMIITRIFFHERLL